MNNKDRRRYEMLVRVRDFGASNGHLFPESSLAQQAFGEVTSGVKEIETHDLAEASASVSARATRKLEARRALVERLMLVAKTAQVVSGSGPDFKAHFQVPDTTNDHLLLTTARKFATHAAPVAEQFIAHGMASTFVADLGARIEQFEGALRDRGVSRDQQMAARDGIKKGLATALAAARKLDVIVSNHLASDSAGRQAWKRNRRIENPYRSRKGAAPPGEETGSSAIARSAKAEVPASAPPSVATPPVPATAPDTLPTGTP
jgi:hypothetical protein